MADASSRYCAHLVVDDDKEDKTLPMSPPPVEEIASFKTSSHMTETDNDDDDESEDDIPLDFPQPPPISPALRRMRSSPWYAKQLDTLTQAAHRTSVSPLLQVPDEWPHWQSQCTSDNSHSSQVHVPTHNVHLQSLSAQKPCLEAMDENLVSVDRNEEISETCELLTLPSLKQHRPCPTRSEIPLPVTLTPTNPLPRLPRIIRKVASMRSEAKHVSIDVSQSPSRRPVPKIRSLKFLSGPGGFSNSSLQSQKSEVRKRSWSLSRPSGFPRSKLASFASSSYINLSATANNGLQSRGFTRSPYPSILRPGDQQTISPLISSNPCLAVNTEDRPANVVTFRSDGRFDLSRGNPTTQVPPCVSPSSSGGTPPPITSVTPPSLYPLYKLTQGVRGKSKNASVGALPQVPKSFINVAPERKASFKLKSRSSIIRISDEHGVGTARQMGLSMKEQGSKVKRIFARASNGVVGWGRQLAAKGSKAMPLSSSTSGSLAPLSGERN